MDRFLEADAGTEPEPGYGPESRVGDLKKLNQLLLIDFTLSAGGTIHLTRCMDYARSFNFLLRNLTDI